MLFASVLDSSSAVTRKLGSILNEWMYASLVFTRFIVKIAIVLCFDVSADSVDGFFSAMSGKYNEKSLVAIRLLCTVYFHASMQSYLPTYY